MRRIFNYIKNLFVKKKYEDYELLDRFYENSTKVEDYFNFDLKKHEKK